MMRQVAIDVFVYKLSVYMYVFVVLFAYRANTTTRYLQQLRFSIVVYIVWDPVIPRFRVVLPAQASTVYSYSL